MYSTSWTLAHPVIFMRSVYSLGIIVVGLKMNEKKSLELYHRTAEHNPRSNHLYLEQIQKSGEGTRVNYDKAIQHFSIYENDNKTDHQVHWELATIFESTKGYTDAHRALYHFRIVADIRRRDEEANRKVAEYFVRATPPRRMSFTHQEFQLSLDKIRNTYSRRERDGSFYGFSMRRLGKLIRTLLLRL